jgi:signal peptidase I
MPSRLTALTAVVLAAAAMTSCSGGPSTEDAGSLRRIEVPTEGMAPTIAAGQVVSVDTDAYGGGEVPEVGDISLFIPTPSASATCGSDPAGSLPYVKRVVGVPGDVVEVRPDGATLRNGEPFAVAGALGANYTMRFPVVPGRRVLVLGDNRPGSCDSHQWRDRDGRAAPFVPVGNVLGRVVL